MAEKKDSIRNLIEQGRRAGKLTSTEISDAMEESSRVIDAEQMEKLYEELLMKSDGLMKTTSSKIFIERQQEISQEEMDHKLQILSEALKKGGRENVRQAMKQVVPTYRDPDEVNREVAKEEETK